MSNDPIVREDSEAFAESETLDEVLQRAPATMASIIVHLLILICLAMWSWRIEKDAPLVIEIGQAETPEGPQIESLVFENVDVDLPAEQEEVSEVEITPLKLASEPMVVESDSVSPDVQLTRLASGSMKGYSPSFAYKIADAQRNGIEIVVVFDSTGSMGPEIEAVKARISQIGKAVLSKIPKARFSLCTYRDLNDSFTVRGLELTQDLGRIQRFIDGVYASGGGDHPEAVQIGMRWAVHQTDYRQAAQKVMLIFGDAPPHRADVDECLELADRFRSYGKGQIFTVTCRKSYPIPEFYSIAQAGGGEAYVMQNSQRLMEDLLVIAFGVENRDQVLRFFDLRKPQPRTRGRMRLRRR